MHCCAVLCCAVLCRFNSNYHFKRRSIGTLDSSNHLARLQAFFDATGGHWSSGALVGKPATVFTSVATQGGGLETTLLTSITQLAHHGAACESGLACLVRRGGLVGLDWSSGSDDTRRWTT